MGQRAVSVRVMVVKADGSERPIVIEVSLDRTTHPDPIFPLILAMHNE